MRTSDFDYQLPAEFIAQRPAQPRDSSRLLLLERHSGTRSHHTFRDLPDLLMPGDTLVLNETRVIPARLLARKVPTGGRAELLLLKSHDDGTWEALVGGRGLVPGRRLSIRGGPRAEIIEDLGGGRRRVRFDRPIQPLLDQIGQMPLPPYIRTALRHTDEYQTIFARQPGSAAAPTAGLHFTQPVFERLAARDVSLVMLTLHVGLDTFAPVTEEEPTQHTIHSEWCELSPSAAQEINRRSQSGGRIVAVGTTSARTLETAARLAGPGQRVAPLSGATNVYILPGFQFRAVDAMVTNFHLPRSTLLMMVSAFAGRELILDAYQQAMRLGYRFYSFGDAMLIV